MSKIAKETYTVNHSWNDIELTAEIDFSVVSIDRLRLYVENYDDGHMLLNTSDDGIINCFLKVLAKACFQVSTSKDLNLEGVLCYFDSADSWLAELFPPLNGEAGIKLVHFTYSECFSEINE
ncbi:DUF2528 family protein [Photobacterium galatheae]|uniref:Uncharacterized protein n=1 Tax=Photobacterium galatheae TaxID=1654360 RepID=A0A066RTI3_9GAMM|nr:DUF2528 family protein [Photobacterium galatheae]KDM91017.1 hypothetical protein EA58_14800 [Photobacterium galatheae]MCM0149031.1 DUF2528 family protein [Photobacterium galatheae]